MHKFILIILISLVLSSCATILGGKRNTISTESATPPQAKVYINDKLIGEGVFKVKVPKAQLQEEDIIIIKCEGYQNDTLIIKRKISSLYAAADFISTLGLSILVDVGTGNIYRPNTQNIIIDLKREEEIK